MIKKQIIKQKSKNKRKLWDFHGGIHPPENKAMSLHSKIGKSPIAKELILPLLQHIGSVATPCVELGDHVLKGQLIATASSLISAPIHASSSGTISAIEDRPSPHPSGRSAPSIVIETDGLDQWCELKPLAKNKRNNPKALLKHIHDGGIVGLGGAGFPSSVKLKVLAKQIKTLIINGAECEPFITADDYLMQNYTEEILDGIDLLAELLQVDEVLFVVENNKPIAISNLKYTLKTKSHIAELVVIPTKYPSGGEKQLIQILTGKELPSGQLPKDIGIVCHNVGTCKAIYDSVILGKPLISRITTLTGDAVNSPQNVHALLGTPFFHLLDYAAIKWNEIDRIVMGGPMMGFSVHNAHVPVVKTTNCIYAPKIIAQQSELESPCIRCGKCAEYCPVSLLPQQLYWHANSQNLDKLKQFNLNDCIECGVCSYVCPSNIPLVQYFRFAKGEAKQHDQDLIKAERSRTRFENRKIRLENEAKEREEKRKARAKLRAKTKRKNRSSVVNTLEKLQTEANSAEKKYKEAARALAMAAKNNNKNLETQQQKVEALKEKASKARNIVQQHLQKNKKTNPNDKTDDKVATLRSKSSELNTKLKQLKKEMLTAKSENFRPANLQEKIDATKKQVDAIKKDLRQALSEQKALSSNQSN